jgi:hypothetical protein
MPAFSQEATSTKKLAVASCASCPSGDGVIVVSGDPTWLIASFVVGVVVGVVLAKVLGGMKRQ